MNETLKKFRFIYLILFFALSSTAQQTTCVLKPPQFTIHFGAGTVRDVSGDEIFGYQRVFRSCPSDGYYSFSSYTRACFNDDWHTLTEDHTAGDADGNMLLVNAGEAGAVFLKTSVTGLKSNTIYELGLWLMNLCRPSDKCPFPLLPNLSIRLETPEGKTIASIATGELPRFDDPRWTRHRAYFTTPASTTTLMLVMADNNPSGCGNDFAIDDIAFRECVKQVTQAKVTSKITTATKPPITPKQVPKKIITPPVKKEQDAVVIKPKTDSIAKVNSVVKQDQKIFTSTPLVLRTRENPLVRRIESEPSEIKIELYDNGQIDGDTVSIFHNNTLIRSHMRLTQRPITITFNINSSQPHHEIIMVAENLGDIPPNTSVMIITTRSKRYEVLITSSEQKNAKVVFDLKE